MLSFLLYIVVYLVIIVLVVLMTEATRRIPIQYTSSTVIKGKTNELTYLPLKINSASVTGAIITEEAKITGITLAELIFNGR